MVGDKDLVKWITVPGLINYQEGLTLMEEQLDKVIKSLEPNTVFLLEHNETYTAGTNYKQDELLTPDRFPVIYTGRGGKFTYHGPGQRIIYPIINLNNGCDAKDLKLYISRLEKWIISTLAEFKIQAFTIPGKIGVWIKNSKNENAKIASIGLRIRKWVAYHGIAINIHTNLDHYSGIIPCGINNFPITSLRDIGIDTSIEEFDIILKKIFIETF